MSLHKLTAGDGYTYLTRQVAVVDSTERGRAGLADYYSQRGESPGCWVGSALADVDLAAGEVVTEAQMLALFGEGRHPNADRLVQDAIRAAVRAGADSPGGVDVAAVTAATQLGRPFLVYSAAPRFRVLVAQRVVAANLARGVHRDTAMDAEARARIRTEVGVELFTAAHGRAPADERELSSFIASQDRAVTTAVAGYDLTFTPVKSVSALWAIAPRPVAAQVRDAHRAAVADALAWLQSTAVYTRGGAGGVQQLDTTGMIAAAFEHRDSRAGDPNLHTHVAVSNKVRVRHLDGTGGRWLALDGRVLHKAAVCASERYNTRLEVELRARLGVTFTPRPDPTSAPAPDTAASGGRGYEPAAGAGRVVREIDGIPAALLQVWSTRRGQVEARRAVLAREFQARHARVPTPVEAVKLAQQATLETRDRKHEPRTEAEQRATWVGEAAGVLGSPAAVTALVDRLVAAPPGPAQPTSPSGVEPSVTGQLVVDTLAVVTDARATWQGWHVRAEAERQTRAHPATSRLAGAQVDALVEDVVAAVLSPAASVPLLRVDPADAAVAGGTPAVLRRADGTSVYEVAGSRLYTSTAVLAAEQVILDAAARTDGHTITDTDVDVALLEAHANGVSLNDAQAHLVRALATSGARVQVAIAPAGSGKTTALATLARAWTAAGGTVLALAPSAAAAGVLRENLTPTHGPAPHTDTLAKLAWHLTHDEPGQSPAWVERIDQHTVIVIDEAAMAATADLATVTAHALARGACVRLVGDDAQLASMAAGGVLRDIATRHGAVTLTELVRFTDPAEAAAGLAIRGGDPAGIGFYLDTHRVHVGDLPTVTDTAYTAWATDRAAGRDAIMLAPTRELVAELNARARTDRLTTSTQPPAPVVALADGTHASVGDPVITRRNDRRLRVHPTDWVSNGHRWVIDHVHDDGRIHVHDPANHRRHLTLPAAYVATHVQLGYATTIHGAQGLTADTSHTVLTGAETRQQLYVALTRGRHANHVHLAMASDGAHESITRPDTLRPPTAGDLLERILTRDASTTSATTTIATLTDPASDLHEASTRYRDALATAAVHVLGPGWTTGIDTLADHTATAITGRTLTDQPAWPTLRGHLAWHTLTGADPTGLLATAAAGDTTTAHDLAAVLDWRLDPTHTRTRTSTRTDGVGPLPWLAAIPSALADHPQWGPYLTARREHVTHAAAAVTAAAAGWTPANTPAWARPFHHPDSHQLRTRLALYRAAHAVPDTDSRPTGPTQPVAADRSVQRRLARQVADTLDTTYRDTWATTATAIGLRPGTDPHWPTLCEQLADLSRAGINAPALLRRAVTEAPLPEEYVAAAIRWRITRHTTITAAAPAPGVG